MRTIVGLVLILSLSCSAPERPTTTGGTGAPPVAVDAAVAVITADAAPPASACADARPSPDHVCMEDCGPPVVRDGDPPPTWSWYSPDDVAARNRGGCPRCLPPSARIATPEGDTAIDELAVGDRVLTLDRDGNRRDARVLAVQSRPARNGHTMVRTTLADGRVVTASAEHPVADGRLLGVLRAGDAVGDSVIIDVEVIRYDGDRTWDLLVSGPTGLYVADGVPLRSTLLDSTR